MAIGTTKGETTDRGGGGVHNYQVRGGQDAATKIGESSLDLTGYMAVGSPVDNTS